MNHSGMMPGDASGMPGSDEGAGFGGTRDLVYRRAPVYGAPRNTEA
jgi:hypothetical protein